MEQPEERASNSANDLEQSTKTCFFKKVTRNKNLRKRVAEEEENNDTGSAVIQTSKTARKAIGHLEFSSQSSIPSHRLLSEKETNEESKVRSFFYDSTKEIQTHTDNRATATLETETEFNKDARALREKVLRQADEALRGNKSADEKLYKGIHGYTDHKAGFRREQTIAGEKAGGAHGPLRASAHIRWSVRFDYQPDICKDYKETGYCGYGDSCKFMHDRGDYKSGWQMDREWDEAEQKRKARMAQGLLDEEDGPEDDEDDDGLPFACFMCREPFKDPVVTNCKHYFCEQCALKHHAKNKHCFVCNKATNGVFNTAFDILKKKSAEKDGLDKKLAGTSRH